jgi:hypothetical protein
MLYDDLRARADFGAPKGMERLAPWFYDQIPWRHPLASLALRALFHACRQGICDDGSVKYFANAGELESASCESHVYSKSWKCRAHGTMARTIIAFRKGLITP